MWRNMAVFGAAATAFGVTPALASQYEFLAAPQIDLSLVYRLDKLTGDIVACQFAEESWPQRRRTRGFWRDELLSRRRGRNQPARRRLWPRRHASRAGRRSLSRQLSNGGLEHLLRLCPAREAGRPRGDRGPVRSLYAGVEVERRSAQPPRSGKGGRGLYANSRDTIFALASGLGKSAVAVFRISGPGCTAALAALAPGATFPARQAVLRTLRHPRTLEPIDRALITRFEAPSSFTGEEVVELSVTGGRAVISATAQALVVVPGLRPAEPGEFAWRGLRRRQARSFGGRRPGRPRRRRD